MNTQKLASDRAAVTSALVAAVAMIAQHVAGRATRDALFLSNFDLSALPLMMSIAALVSLPVLLAMSRAMMRQTPGRVVPAVFAVGVIGFLGTWGVSLVEPRSASVLVYLQLAVLGPIAISGFWLLVNERFDPHTAKRMIARIAAAATLGGIVGGLLTERVSALLSARDMLLFLAALNSVACLGVAMLARGSDTRSPDDDHHDASFRAAAATPYLRQIAGMVALLAISSAIFDYILRAEATHAFDSVSGLLRFFALFHMTTSVVAFALQALAGRRVLARLGIGGTVAMLPALLVTGGVASIALSGFFSLALWRIIALRGIDAVLQNSLFRSGYELLYTPLTRARRRPIKTLFDVGFDRFGQIVGSGIVTGVVAVLPVHNGTTLLTIAIVSAAATLLLALRLRSGYVLALEESLRQGSLELGESELVDPTTRTVWESSVSLSRAQILRAIAASEAEEQGMRTDTRRRAGASTRADVDPDASTGVSGRSIHAASRREDPILESVSVLRSGDSGSIRRLLTAPGPLDPALVTHVIPLLEHDTHHHDASRALRTVADAAAGQLLDALLDPNTSFTIRRRLPRVLRRCTTARAVSGLMLGLGDRQFDVRHHCAQAIAAITERNPALRPSADDVFAAARREIEVSRQAWDSQEPAADESTDDMLHKTNELIRRRTSLSLEHVFTILALVLEREPLELAFRALRDERVRIRGTALEYLENVLPSDIRGALWPYLGMGAARSSPKRNESNTPGDDLGVRAPGSIHDKERS